jgi:hypothetical protein
MRVPDTEEVALDWLAEGAADVSCPRTAAASTGNGALIILVR